MPKKPDPITPIWDALREAPVNLTQEEIGKLAERLKYFPRVEHGFRADLDELNHKEHAEALKIRVKELKDHVDKLNESIAALREKPPEHGENRAEMTKMVKALLPILAHFLMSEPAHEMVDKFKPLFEQFRHICENEFSQEKLATLQANQTITPEEVNKRRAIGDRIKNLEDLNDLAIRKELASFLMTVVPQYDCLVDPMVDSLIARRKENESGFDRYLQSVQQTGKTFNDMLAQYIYHKQQWELAGVLIYLCWIDPLCDFLIYTAAGKKMEPESDATNNSAAGNMVPIPGAPGQPPRLVPRRSAPAA